MRVVIENLDFAIRENTASINFLSTSQFQFILITLIAFLQYLVQQHCHTSVAFPFLPLPDDSRAAPTDQ